MTSKGGKLRSVKTERAFAYGMAALIILGLLTVPAAAQSNGAVNGERTKEVVGEAESGSDAEPILTSIVYAPKDVGAPAVTTSGGVRAVDQGPTVAVLAPTTPTLMFSAQPTFYWFVSAESPAPLRVTLFDLQSTDLNAVLDVRLDPVDQPGIYALSLAEYGISLDPTAHYAWSVALETPFNALVEQPAAAATFDYVGTVPPAPPAGASPTLARAQQLAGAGHWYETLEEISRGIDTNDPSVPWRELRADLMEQIGLLEVAAFERSIAGR